MENASRPRSFVEATIQDSPGASRDDTKSSMVLLKWNDSESFILSQINKLWDKMKMTDVSISCPSEGKIFKAHKLILSLWSPYFQQLFDETAAQFNTNTYPVIILRDTLASDMELILQFMYQGQVSIKQGDADRFIKTAESLKIAGLSQNIRRSTAAVISTTPRGNDTPSTSTPKSNLQSSDEGSFVASEMPTPRTKNVGNQRKGKTPVKSKDSTQFTTRSEQASSNIETEETNETDETNDIFANATTTFMSGFATNTTTTTVASTSLGRNNSEGDNMNINQVMPLHVEPFRIGDVQEAIAAENAASSCTSNVRADGQPVLVYTLTQDEIFPDQELGRDNNLSGNNISSSSLISPYGSFISSDLEQQLDSIVAGNISQGGTFTISSAFGGGVFLPQHQHVTILQQDLSTAAQQEGISGNQFQIVQQPTQSTPNNNDRNKKIEVRNVKIEKREVGDSQDIQFVSCPRCGKSVKEQSLKVHLKRSHLDEGVVLSCPLAVCQKKIKSKGVYYKHMFAHRQKGEVPKGNPKTKKQSSTAKLKSPYNGKERKREIIKTEPSAPVLASTNISPSRNDVRSNENEPGPSSSATSTLHVIYGTVATDQIIGANTSMTQQQYQYTSSNYE